MPSIVGYLIVHFKNCSVELYADGTERAIYSGIVQRAESQEENGYRLLRMELGSGSLLMDMEKEKRTFQDISMTYGQVLTRIASESGIMAVYPRLLDETGIVSLKEKLLDDMEGIRIAGSGALHILAAGEVKIAASEVRVAGTGGVILYEGTAEGDREGNIVVAPQGKIELSAEDGERAIHNRGKEVTYYLAWEHEDLSHPSNRYRDAPQQKDYDWMKLGTHVAAGLMIAGGIAALAAGGVLLLGAAAATAIKIGMTVFLAGSLYVGEQALSDIRSGRVSDLDQYTRKAVGGSVVGFLTGASGLLMAEASLLGVLALGFGEGLVGSIVTQKLLNEDGELDF